VSKILPLRASLPRDVLSDGGNRARQIGPDAANTNIEALGAWSFERLAITAGPDSVAILSQLPKSAWLMELAETPVSV
jgi:hypothetical protein